MKQDLKQIAKNIKKTLRTIQTSLLQSLIHINYGENVLVPDPDADVDARIEVKL